MRNIFNLIAALMMAAAFSFVSYAADREWKDAPGGLPYYKYTGTSNGDPAILIGNSHIKVRTHVSGIYELISGERCWARFNADPARSDYGKNRATVYFGKKANQLVGPGSLAMTPGKCEVYSGAGFVRYDYDLGNGIKCSRMLSVMPSADPQGGAPLFLVTLTFTNEGSSAKNIAYDEAISPNFVQSSYQMVPENERPLKYHITTDITFRCIEASFGPVPQNFSSLSLPSSRSLDESAPQSVFIYSDNAFLVVNNGELKASVDEFKLRPRRSHTFHVVLGFAGDNNKEMAEAAIAKAEPSSFGVFSSMWKKCIPDFSTERDANLRNNLYNSAYMLEASAVYNDYFKETFIPGKLVETIRTGQNSSNSDHINAALQACYTHPELAKSIIRYVMKQTSFDGMIPDSNKGFGYIPSDSYSFNLVQLEVINAVTEYLRRTGDYDFLEEWLTVYPMERGELITVKSVLESYYIYPRNRSYTTSTMAAMQAAYLPGFLHEMEMSGKMSKEFIASLQKYIEKSLNQVKEQNKYSTSDLQYLLQVESLPASAKRDILDEAVSNGTADIRVLPALATFDGIEASTMFRSFVGKNDNSFEADIADAWTIYSYYRLKE